MSIYLLNDIYYNEIPNGSRLIAAANKNTNNDDNNEVNLYESFDEEDSSADENTPQQHALKILESLQKQREYHLNLDLEIKILIGEKMESLSAHKFLVSSCCPYVRGLLDNTSECKVQSMDLTHLDGESVSEIINWCYSGVCKLTTKNSQYILIAADFLCIDPVIKLSVDFISSNLTYENCSEMYILSFSYETFGFRKKVYNYILRHFYPLLTQSYLNELALKDILDLSSDDSLMLLSNKYIELEPPENEYKLFEIIRDYLKVKKSQNSWLEFLTRSIRLGFFTSEQLKSLITNDKWLDSCDQKSMCVQLLMDLLNKKEKSIIDSDYPAWTMPRLHLKGFKYIKTDLISSSGFFGDASPVSFDDLDSELNRKNHKMSLVIIRGIKIFLREWDDLTIIGGLEITYNGDMKYTHGLNTPMPEGVFEFQLKDGEYINKIHYGCGFMLDSLTFYTNLGVQYGPYGGRGGRKGYFTPPKKCGFLAAMTGDTVTSRNIPAVRYITFYWGLPTKNLRSVFRR